MGLINWMGLGKKKEQDVNIIKVKRQDAAIGEMASGNPTAAAAALAEVMAQTHASTKILMVQDGAYLPQVTDYALKMAQRLDCEIIALDVSDIPLQFSGERKERESNRFHEKAGKNAANFAMQAKAQGLKMKHIMEIADQEEVIARLSAEDAGIRYVLTKPDQDSLRENQERVQVPVFDLNCSRLAR
jgi:hypothetical protein